ncbi:MAG: serine/threonine-protein kinase [Archangium sp.]|nr:serine/threonine-protein kinase [Archangium sp.]MDP3156334.1 serine/threonine-protein kinase [Archangium sp.]
MSPAETTRFGKYELLDRIAAGGMAEIFRARYEPAPGVTKQVVIKRILPHYAENKAFIGMFTNEAKIVMGLSHGNIAQVFDFGSIDGDYFLAMELVDGHPLSKVVKRARTLGIPVLPPEFCAFVCAEMLKGLHYAHARLDETGRPLKIVHRDVSPQNVLISYEGQVKLVDFGIAKARNASSEETAANAVKGKYAYFAPEQAKAKELDARTDVFASGIVLYELLTGQLPFQGRLMDVMARIVRGQFQKPRELNPRIPPDLERVVLKAMALEKNDRYQTAEAFQQDLNRFLANNHPEFTGGMVTLFLHLLFEEELVKDGRPVQIPREFVERAQKWKQPLPPPQDPGKRDEAEDPTEMVAMSDPKLHFGSSPKFDDVPAPPPKFPWVRAVALLAAAAAVGFGAVTVMQRLKEGTLEITSVPTGAEVFLDGKVLPSKTPTQVARLSGDRTLRLEVKSPGYQVWKNEVPLKSGQHLLVEAKLEVTPPPAPPKPPEPIPVKVDPPPLPPEPPPAPDLVVWPAAKFALDATRHRLDLSTSGAVLVNLEPTKTYRVSLLGKGITPGWAFYVVSDGGAQPGTFGADPLLIKSASKFYAFHVPATLLGSGEKDENKARSLSVLIEGQKKAQLKSVSTKLNFPSSQRVTVTGLNAATAYELTPRQGTPPAVAREGGAPLRLVVVGAPSGLIIAPIDQALRLEGLTSFWVTFIDDLNDAESGRLMFELREVRPIKKRNKR